MNDRPARRLDERLGVLTEIVALAEGRLPPEVAVRAAATAERAGGRLGHGTGLTVVALAGSTGSGKSSTFNALAGRDLAATGVRRPTTSSTQAAVFAADGELGGAAAGLLDWLGVHQRHVVADRQLDGLVLLDLPDHDSVHVAHRQEVDRLVRVVDVFVWVVDPQKYADAAVHRGYLQRFAGHADVTVVVLNQIDTLPPADRRATLDDLARLLRADGQPVAKAGAVGQLADKVTRRAGGVRIMATSALTGEGIDALRRELTARVSEQRAVVTRLSADLDWIADDLDHAVGNRGAGRDVPPAATRRLAAALAQASGADVVADSVEAAHRRRGAQAAGWPPTRWLARLRPDPLRRLGLDRTPRDGSAADAEPPPPVARTSLPPPSAVTTAAVAGALRRVADEASAGLPASWRQRIGTVATSQRAELDDALDRAVASTDLPTGRPRWWTVAGVLQRLLAGAMVVGLAWLAVVFVVSWLGLPDLPAPHAGAVPLPTLLALGGAGAGLLLAAAARWATGRGARRRAAKARRALEAATADVARRLVLDPVTAELRTLDDLRDLVGKLRR